MLSLIWKSVQAEVEVEVKVKVEVEVEEKIKRVRSINKRYGGYKWISKDKEERCGKQTP